MKRRFITFIGIGLLSVAVSGCLSATDPHKKAKQGAAVGTAAGAVVGAVVGHQSGNRNTGAVVGAVVGAGIGTAVGHRMDKQQAELERVQGIEVARTADDEIAITMASDILYDVDSSALRFTSQSTLNEMAGVFTNYPDTAISVVGHADSTGSEEHNQQLSTRRANSVRDYLSMQGIASSRVDAVGFGEMYPRATNETAAGRQLNRRVEITIKAPPG